jgi:hypothetical protein
MTTQSGRILAHLIEQMRHRSRSNASVRPRHPVPGYAEDADGAELRAPDRRGHQRCLERVRQPGNVSESEIARDTIVPMLQNDLRVVVESGMPTTRMRFWSQLHDCVAVSGGLRGCRRPRGTAGRQRLRSDARLSSLALAAPRKIRKDVTSVLVVCFSPCSATASAIPVG